MIVNKPQDFEGMVPSNRIAFKIAANAQLMDILSNLIYKDKVLAVIRELSCNAYDAHIAAKNPALFTVQVPTRLDPTFAVEDTGVGLSEDKIGDIFWTYGSSTKTETNDQIGALGIGSKSPFAYTKSSFIVRSRFDGVETSYLCFINEKGTPDGAVTNRTATDAPNGVRVELGIRAEDINSFHSRIVSFFRYWKVKPTLVNGDEIDWAKTKPMLEGTGWWLEHQESEDFHREAKAVMGNVAYPISISAIGAPSNELRFVARNAFIIDFPLGELAFAASREELSYDEATVKAVELGAKRVMKEFYGKLLDDSKEYKGSAIDTITRYQTYVRQLDRTFGFDVAERSDVKNIELELTDGTKLTKAQGRERTLTLSTDKQSSLLMYDLVRSSTGNVRLKQAREITLTKQEAQPADKTGVITFKERTRTVQWFPPTLKPKKSIKGNTTADFLADGWTHKSTKMPVSLPNYGTLIDWEQQAGKRLYFVLNDCGPRGGIGARAYFADYRNYRNRDIHDRVTFVDHDTKAPLADFGLAEVQELLKGTAADGATIIKLSQLPNFAMPKVEPAAPRPTSGTVSTPRGWVEVRRVTFTPKGEQVGGRFGSVHGYFRKLVENNSEYVKVDPATLTSLYAFSAPGGSMDKDLRNKMSSTKMAYAFAAGALDKFAQKDADGTPALQFIVRNADDIEALRKKGSVLTSLEDMYASIEQADVSSVKDYIDLARSITACGTHAYSMTNEGVLYSTIRKKLVAVLPTPSLYVEVSKMVEGINSFFDKDVKRIALAHLSTVIDKNIGNDKSKVFDDMVARYPLLPMLTGVRDANTAQIESIVSYITMEDKRAADKAAAKAAAAATASAQAAVNAASAVTPAVATV